MVAVILLFNLVWIMSQSVLGLDEAVFRAPFLMWEQLKRPLVLALAGLFVIISYHVKDELSWEAIDPSGNARIIVLATTAILTWIFSAYQMNYFFGQEHLGDRLCLIVLWLALWRHPLFIYPFIATITTISLQFRFPVFGYFWFLLDKRLPWDMMILFAAYLPVQYCLKLNRRFFVFLAIALTGFFYFNAGVGKIFYAGGLRWVLGNDMSHLLPAGWIYRMHTWMNQAEIESVARSMSVFAVPMQVGALLLELGGILLIWGRRSAQLGLVGVIGLHALILVTSGIFFWTWMLLDLVLIFVLWRGRGRFLRPIFNRYHRGLWLAMYCLGIFFLLPTSFFWYDTPFVNRFRLVGTGASGQTYELAPSDFSLYELEMVQSRFFFLRSEPRLVETYGATHSPVVARFLNQVEPAQLPKVKAAFGEDRYSEETSRRFTEFLVYYTHNRYSYKRSWPLRVLNWLQAPNHFFVRRPEGSYQGQEPLVSLTAVDVEYFTYPTIEIIKETEIPLWTRPVPPPSGAR